MITWSSLHRRASWTKPAPVSCKQGHAPPSGHPAPDQANPTVPKSNLYLALDLESPLRPDSRHRMGPSIRIQRGLRSEYRYARSLSTDGIPLLALGRASLLPGNPSRKYAANSITHAPINISRECRCHPDIAQMVHARRT